MKNRQGNGEETSIVQQEKKGEREGKKGEVE